MQLSFLRSFLYQRFPSPRTRGPGSQVFTNLPAALEWVIHPKVQFPISWMRETGLAPEHLFQTEAQCQSVDKWLRGVCYQGCWGCILVNRGPWLPGDFHGSWAQDWEWQTTWKTAVWGLAHWHFPPLGFCRMRFCAMKSGSYKSEVTNGKAVGSCAETWVGLMN